MTLPDYMLDPPAAELYGEDPDAECSCDELLAWTDADECTECRRLRLETEAAEDASDCLEAAE